MTTEIKYFTPSEAIKTLPLVRSIVRDILNEGREIKDLADKMSVEEIHLDPEMSERFRKIQIYLEELEEIGCVYKDWNFTFGLVDFPSVLNGEEVYLCWRSDEETIRFYHSMQTGYSERKLIPEECYYN